jgi:hypothetical protein
VKAGSSCSMQEIETRRSERGAGAIHATTAGAGAGVCRAATVEAMTTGVSGSTSASAEVRLLPRRERLSWFVFREDEAGERWTRWARLRLPGEPMEHRPMEHRPMKSNNSELS